MHNHYNSSSGLRFADGILDLRFDGNSQQNLKIMPQIHENIGQVVYFVCKFWKTIRMIKKCES